VPAGQAIGSTEKARGQDFIDVEVLTGPQPVRGKLGAKSYPFAVDEQESNLPP
jgi:hypothetical protein